MKRLVFNGGFRVVQPLPQSTPKEDVKEVEVPVVHPDPSTYMVLSTRKIDGVTVKTVSDRATGNVFVLTFD